MTFSHKTINILFHIRKFLSDKDALNTLCGSESCLLSKKDHFVKHFEAKHRHFLRNTLFIFSLTGIIPQSD